METQQQQLETVDAIATGGMLPATSKRPQLPPAYQSETQWQRTIRKVVNFLDQLPEYLSSFFSQNQRSLINLALILTVIITLKVLLAIISAVNDIPLLAPTFELIGIGYFAWFSFRYLIQAKTRQELTEKIQLWKQQIVNE